MAVQGNAEERPQSQRQRRAHAEQADAEAMMLLWAIQWRRAGCRWSRLAHPRSLYIWRPDTDLHH